MCWLRSLRSLALNYLVWAWPASMKLEYNVQLSGNDDYGGWALLAADLQRTARIQGGYLGRVSCRGQVVLWMWRKSDNTTDLPTRQTCQPDNILYKIKNQRVCRIFCMTFWLQMYMAPSKELKQCLVFSQVQLTITLAPSFYDSTINTLCELSYSG